MKKGRTSVWDKVFGANRILPPEDGDDVNLFTVNAASHVHVDVTEQEAIPAVNVLNGFTGAQIALTAHSNIWKGELDPEYKCVAEKLWDWWIPEKGRVGVPEKHIDDIEDYVRTISRFRPVYAKREGRPLVLTKYQTFADYYRAPRAIGIDNEGREVDFVPEKDDIDLHSTCYWYNARLSHYYTVENRVCDEQPPDDLITIAALTLGLLSALPEAWEELASLDWQALRESREAACRDGLDGEAEGLRLLDLAQKLVGLAGLGLRRRGLGEERFLDPLERRILEKQCPADEARHFFETGGIDELLRRRKL
jgi:gamma-glutamylcysteine synthetase